MNMINQKKKSRFFTKLIIAMIIAVVAIIFFKNYQKEIFQDKKNKEFVKEKSFENEFEISEEFSQDSDKSDFNDSGLSNLTIEKLKQGGAEFIYQLLLHNQAQIQELKNQNEQLKRDFVVYKSNEKVARMILQYVSLREKIYKNINYSKALKSFELLTLEDRILRQKVDDFQESLYDFQSYENLQENFMKHVPDLIALKSHDENGDFYDNLKFKLSKIITIRKVDENDQEIDGFITRMIDFLQKEECKKALKEIDFLEEKYQKNLVRFSKKLKARCVFEKRDEEIMLYLESLIK